MSFAEYERYDGLGLAELVRDRQVTAGELVEAALARIEARNPALNAVVHTMAEQAQAEAERILRHAHLQVEAERQQVVQQLRRQVGTMATALAVEFAYCGRLMG